MSIHHCAQCEACLAVAIRVHGWCEPTARQGSMHSGVIPVARASVPGRVVRVCIMVLPQHM